MLKRIDASLIQSIRAMSGGKSAHDAAITLAAFLGAAGVLIAVASLVVPDTVVLYRRRGADIPMDWALWIVGGVVCLFAARAFMIRNRVEA
jgi:hypothetical protein